jgi:hypothetical protein
VVLILDAVRDARRSARYPNPPLTDNRRAVIIGTTSRTSKRHRGELARICGPS